MALGLVRAEWSGFAGGPGLTQLAVAAGGGGTFSDADAGTAVAAVANWLDSFLSLLPNDVTIRVQPVVDEYDEQTGLLTNSHSTASTPLPITGTAAGGFASGVGARVQWDTAAISGGRRRRGSTFIVPLAATAYDVDGSLTTTAIDGIRTPATAMLAELSAGACSLMVWSRPPIIGGTGGFMTAVQTVTVKDKVAMLRTRRD